MIFEGLDGKTRDFRNKLHEKGFLYSELMEYKTQVAIKRKVDAVDFNEMFSLNVNKIREALNEVTKLTNMFKDLNLYEDYQEVLCK